MKTYQKIGTALGFLGALGLGYISPVYAREATPNAKPKVAVLDFKYNTNDKPNVEDMLMTGLGKADCIELYERSGLRKILAEMKIGKSGIIDEKTAIEIGKLAGVEKVVLGSYNLFENNQARIDVRYIDVKTGKVEKTESVVGNKEDPLLVDRLTDKLNYDLCGSAVSTPPTAEPKAPAEDDLFKAGEQENPSL